MGYYNLADVRQEFPVTKQVIYLNHAAVAPLSRRASDAMKGLIDDVSAWGSTHYSRWMEAYEGLRQSAAALIGASAEEIAIVKNTSEGISIVANGFEWNKGDRIVAFEEEFPSNYFPWLRLQSLGVEVTWLSIYDPIERIASAITGARLLAVSYVNYLSGYRVDLQAIGRLCRDARCFFFVDAIQGLGALPIDVQRFHIDGLAADGHKWLLGPEGNGILYVRREWLDRIEPVEFGWTNPAGYSDFSSRDMTLRPDAGRYECGTLNTVGCFGLRAAIDLLLEVGIERISAQVLSLSGQLASGLRDRGCQLMVEPTKATDSGIVSFRHPSVDARVIVKKLNENGVSMAPRQGWVRAAPHFYVTSDEIDYVLGLLPAV